MKLKFLKKHSDMVVIKFEHFHLTSYIWITTLFFLAFLFWKFHTSYIWITTLFFLAFLFWKFHTSYIWITTLFFLAFLFWKIHTVLPRFHWLDLVPLCRSTSNGWVLSVWKCFALGNTEGSWCWSHALLQLCWWGWCTSAVQVGTSWGSTSAGTGHQQRLPEVWLVLWLFHWVCIKWKMILRILYEIARYISLYHFISPFMNQHYNQKWKLYQTVQWVKLKHIKAFIFLNIFMHTMWFFSSVFVFKLPFYCKPESIWHWFTVLTNRTQCHFGIMLNNTADNC